MLDIRPFALLSATSFAVSPSEERSRMVVLWVSPRKGLCDVLLWEGYMSLHLGRGYQVSLL